MAQAEIRIIETEEGPLELVPPADGQLRGLARYWPMELLYYTEGSPDWGLVFQHGDEEVFGVKMQFPDMPEKDAQVWHYVYRTWIAAGLPHYLQMHHRGVMVPCAYIKEKSPGMAEAGLAFFVAPDPENQPSQGNGAELSFDQRLGPGASRMVWDMIHSLGGSNTAPGPVASRPIRSTLKVIGLELRPRLQIGRLAMHFVIEGQNLLVVKYPLNEKDPVWTCLVRAGFRSLPYAPMVCAGFPGPPPADLEHM